MLAALEDASLLVCYDTNVVPCVLLAADKEGDSELRLLGANKRPIWTAP